MGTAFTEMESYLLIYKDIDSNIYDVKKYFLVRYYKKYMYTDMPTYVRLHRDGN